LQGQLNPESLSQWWYPLINDPYEIIFNKIGWSFYRMQ
jgi:hypothetical protein